MIVLCVLALAYVVWSLSRDPRTECENPRCEDCPFPKCERGEK